MTSGPRRDTPVVVQDEGSEPNLDIKTRRKEVRRSLAQDAVNLPNLLTFGRIVMIRCSPVVDGNAPTIIPKSIGWKLKPSLQLLLLFMKFLVRPSMGIFAS